MKAANRRGQGAIPVMPLNRDAWLGLLLMAAVALAYAPVWHAGFVWDDDAHVTANPVIVGPLGLKEIWTTSAARICPLTLTTFWCEHAMWGLDPVPYHLVNVFQQAVSAVLLWQVLRSLHLPGAWLGAALWALHPVQVESVAWISEMKNTQSGLFHLLSILFYVRSLRERETGHRGKWRVNFALTVVFAALAMASKSSTVILPLELCLVAWWVEGRWDGREAVKLAPVFLLSALSCVLAIWTQRHEGADVLQQARSWPERLATAGDAVWFYLGKLLWPHPLVTIYPRWQIDASRVSSYLPLVALAIVALVLGQNRQTWGRPWFFALAYFVAALLPVLGFVGHGFLSYSFVGDHFQYLASMGPLALAGAGLAGMANVLLPQKPRVQASLAAALLVVLGMTTWQRAWTYQSEEVLWMDTLKENPNCAVAYNNLGGIHFHRGEKDQAGEMYRKALAIDPDYAEGHLNLGILLSSQGRIDDAMVEYQRALALDPGLAEARYNRGKAFAEKGEVDAAMEEYRKTLQIDPNYKEAHTNLGLALAQKGQVDGAIEQYREALRIDPGDAKAHNDLGIALAAGGRLDEAMVEYGRALEIEPNVAEVHNSFGVALFQEGRAVEAAEQYRQALAINPRLAAAEFNLGNSLTKLGRVDDAIKAYEAALAINPGYTKVRTNLGVAFAQKGDFTDAIAQFQEVVRLNPADGNAQRNLARVEEMARRPAGGP